MLAIKLISIFILTALSAFFVATEFSIVRARASRIEQLIVEGNKKAVTVKEIINNVDVYLSACQLGITITSLGLGWLGEPAILHLIKPLMAYFPIPSYVSHVLSIALAFSIITYINVVLGELFPKSIAIINAEKVVMLLSTPLIAFYKVMFPFIWLLNHASRQVAKLLGAKDTAMNDEAPSEEELQIILEESYKNGQINVSEYNYVNRIFAFDNRLANEIMIPRTEMVSLPVNTTLAEAIHTIERERYTRYPITKNEDKDEILGFIHLKHILTDCYKNKIPVSTTLHSYVQPIIHIIESTPIQKALIKMQKEGTSIAILHDEFGGTAGLITVEDILEEIVGEIRDEFDDKEQPYIQKINDQQYILDSKLSLTELNQLLSLSIPDEEIHTLGGWILSLNPNLKKEETIEYNGYVFQIEQMRKQHIFSFRVQLATSINSSVL